jgi:hypothetical protein
MADIKQLREELAKDGGLTKMVNEEACASRQTARGALEDRARRLHGQAHDIEMLLHALPAKLPPDADQALWSLVMQAG